jgi:ribosomal protein S18 acetylase RimI-like enzyme
MMRGHVALRALAAPADFAALAQLDLTFHSPTIYAVERRADGFTLLEQRASPPLENRYEVEWSELAGAARAIIAEWRGQLVGVGALTINAWNRRGTLTHLYVDRAHRGSGIGTQLVDVLVRHAAALEMRAVWVETQNTNVAAVRFYQAQGFELCGLDMSLYDPQVVVPFATALFLSRTCGGAPNGDSSSGVAPV